MFVLCANKSEITIKSRETVTSGSVNTYCVQFEFSEDWDGLERVAVFTAGPELRSVPLDSDNRCTIPWEVLTKSGMHLFGGACGKRDEEIVLPTIWANMGRIRPGAVPGDDSRPPTPELWRQELAGKGDGLDYDGLNLSLMSGGKLLSTVQVAGGGGGGVVPNIQATAETLPAGSEATVTRTGSDTNPVFHFGIPEGDQGEPGPVGPQGPPGPPGKNGEDGATFTPTVSEEGVISWTNDGGLPNPEPVDIKGAPGSKGEPGTAGKNATINGHNAIVLAPGENVTIETAEDGTVTISAASGQHIYSTEEQVVGRWIDGKPVYSRTLIIKFNLIGSNEPMTFFKASSYSIDFIINWYGSWSFDNAPSTRFYSPGTYSDMIRHGDAIDFYQSATSSSPASTWIIYIFYTKTTDQATIELPSALTAAPAQALYKAAPQSAAAVTLDVGGGETVKNKQIDELHSSGEEV